MKRIIVFLIPLIFILACKKDDNKIETEPQVEKPVSISITTNNLLTIDSKESYLLGEFALNSENTEDDLVAEIKIRGRGNTTWLFPKKSYQIKFDEKQSLLGMPDDKRWILLANYSDKTMLRTETAFELSRSSNIDWTPESRFIELTLNNEYVGVYQLTQKVEESSNRVDVGDDGYLLEVDQPSKLGPNDVYFKTNKYIFNIQEPEVELNDEKYLFIKNFIQQTEDVLLGNNFLDPVEGYTKYIDVESFVDWYLINEITKNNDAKFHSSVYLNYIPGGKLKMGPVWDFDISLGNINYNGNEDPLGYFVKNTYWITRLFEDPEFVARVKTRFNHFYDNKDMILENIDLNATYLDEAQKRNFTTWPILGVYVWPNYVYLPTYEEEVSYMKDFLETRFEWLKESYEEL